MSKILQFPELRVNPFGDRICRIFSSSHDGDCTFEDFLDMMSVFSDEAPKAVKAEHAFRIFGKHVFGWNAESEGLWHPRARCFDMHEDTSSKLQELMICSMAVSDTVNLYNSLTA